MCKGGSYMEYKLTAEENAVFSIIDAEFETLVARFYDSNVIFNVDKIKKSYEVAKYFHRDTRRKSGELYLYHPLAVLQKLYDDGFVDPNILVAAMLHDTVEDTAYTLVDIERDFGNEVREYVHAVTKIEASIDPLSGDTKKSAQQQTDEHMLELGQKYPFALYIKLADRWHNLHTCGKMSMDSIRKNVAHTKSVLIPLARKIGCNVIADQLRDACLLAKHPEEYANILKQLNENLKNSRKGIEKTLSTLRNALQPNVEVDTQFMLPYPCDVKADIRLKIGNANLTRSDLFSVYQYQPYVIAFCKLTEVTEKTLRGQFVKICKQLINDGIITVIDENDKPEIKSTTVSYIDVFDSYYNKIRIVLLAKQEFWKYRNPLAQHENIPRSTAAFLPSDKRITVHSKDGHPIEIEKGATVLDFAFLLNSEIGAHFESAEVNSNIVEIDYILQPEDTILIHKSEEKTARIEWFKILETKAARNRLITILK